MGNTGSRVSLDSIFRPTNLVLLLISLYGIRVVRRTLKVRGDLAKIGFLPGPWCIYGPFTILGSLLPPISYLNRRYGWQFTHKYQRELYIPRSNHTPYRLSQFMSSMVPM